MTEITHAGGSAGAAGYEYQHRAAAYFAVAVLAEQGWPPVCGLPPDISADWLQCESLEPVDDILVHTSRDGYLFGQVKRSLRISTDPDSAYASAVSQFVRQFRMGAPTQAGRRSLDPERDRLLLVVPARCPGTVRVVLRDLLDRVRGLPAGAPLDPAAASKPERDVLNRTVECVQAAWRAESGATPSDDEVRALLGLTHALCLDVETGCADERLAKELLRNVVLRDPRQADEAWDSLVRTCANAAAAHSAMDRKGLQDALIRQGIDLRGVRSYWDRIEELRQRSRDTLALTADLARIRVGTDTVKLERRCTQALHEAAEADSLLVVGEPGAGKSGVLHDLADGLLSDGRDVVYLTAEWTADLGIDLVEVLANWPGVRPAFLVIDALDSVRSEQGARTLRDVLTLMMERETRWHIVASIRTFDLRHSPSLQERFAGHLPSDEFRSEEFTSVRHFRIPKVQPEEWDAIREQSQRLADLVDLAPEALRGLLENLFNLSLVAELLGSDVPVDELTGISTQSELLDRYWRHRVIDEDRQRDAREGVLRRAVEEMVRTRVLRVNRAALASHAPGDSLHDVLSRNVLRPSSPDDEVLEFAHHILFDYAVARLLFRGTHDQLIGRLTTDPILALIAQPSLRLHFQHLWYVAGGDRSAFCDAVFALAGAPDIPEIGRLVGPSVAAENAATLEDLVRLCSALSDTTHSDAADRAAQAFGHLVGALVAADPAGRPLVGDQGGPWCDLLRRIAQGTDLARIAGSAVFLLWHLCDRAQGFTPEQADAAGYAARALMGFAVAQEHRNEGQIIKTCRAVCRTFATDPAASGELIRIGLGQERPYTPHELYWLTNEIKRLIPHDPAVVEEIYEFAFCRPAPSVGAQPRVTSRILPLSFAADQDWGMCQYHLVNTFPQFLRTAPAHATRAVIRAVDFHDGGRREQIDSEPGDAAAFEFLGRRARLRADYSHIWARGRVGHDALMLLGHFESYLDEIGRDQPAHSQIRQVVEAVVESSEMAVFWRALLHAGAEHPRTVGIAVKPLAWAQPALVCLDTASEMGRFLGAVFPLLDEGERQRVEQAILAIPNHAEDEQRAYRERDRNWLLSCLPEEQLVTDAAKARAEQLREEGGVTPVAPAVEIGPVRTVPFTTHRFLESRGVPLEEPANQHILDLVRPVEEFCSRPVEEALGAEALNDARLRLEALREALDQAEADEQVHPEQREYGWDYLALACGKICRTDDPQPMSEYVCFARDTLLAASQRLHPEPQEDDSAKFDLGWGSPAARIEAASGLVSLARHGDFLTDEVRDAVRRLGLSDECAAVRFQISERLLRLYHTDQELMWNLAEAMVAEEDSPGVLDGLVHGAFWQLAGPHMDRVARLIRNVLSRTVDGRRAGELKGECIALLFDLCIWHEHPVGSEVIEGIARNPVESEGSSTVIARLRRLITLGPVEPVDQRSESVRSRAWTLLQQMTQRLCEQWERLLNAHQPPDAVWSDTDQERAQRVLQLLDRIAAHLYFASGAFDDHKEPDEGPLTPEQRDRFFGEAGRVFDLLVGVGYPSITHYLLEMLEAFVSGHPKDVFLQIGRVVAAGMRGGYQFESMGADLVVKLVERYLAEQRRLIQEDNECRETLLSIIDTFVQAGWPSARRLVYRLEDVFR